jgi:hypothetical protein
MSKQRVIVEAVLAGKSQREATPDDTVARICDLRRQFIADGCDAGPLTRHEEGLPIPPRKIWKSRDTR